MLRCECQARLGRGWRFCEACGRPVVEPTPTPTGADPGLTLSGTVQTGSSPGREPEPEVSGVAMPLAAPPPTVQAKWPAQCVDHLDWRFGWAPVLIGAAISLPLAWLSAWVVPLGAALGACWAWRRWSAIRRAMAAFTLEWIFEKVVVYGPCALSERAWWPTGVLYLTDQTLKFKPFAHTHEREVSLDPVRLTGIDFPERRGWPADWRCLLLTSTYGPVFGIMKVFDRSIWEQHLKAAKQRVLLPATQELP